MPGIFYEIKPRKLKASHKPENWVFAEYMEFPSQRDDGLWFRALIFRDIRRQVYGADVYLGKDYPHTMNHRDWATKIVIDKSFRDALLTTDTEIIRLWKNH